MTEEEAKAMIQFFGTVHAQAKQTDQMVVGSSNHLRPISRDIQGQLEQVLRSPDRLDTTHTSAPYVEPPPISQPATYIEPPVAINDTHYNTNEQSHAPTATHNTYDVLVEISNNLNKIATILDNYCNAPKKLKNIKQR